MEALLTVDAVHATRIFWYSSIKSVPISYFVPHKSFLDHTWVSNAKKLGFFIALLKRHLIDSGFNLFVL
ncbi:hypothetical protein [Bacillus sp. UNC438CL73TsuS30]|uniref:hypothetical protein n=1 Tax=Bacillus sp. UNC438CL73TsuS30 TaxID=1340434 RepID=UPI00047D9C5C|nr:hypothetical protein [Bacillus sp. UNC438CL73TsuS30]